MKIFNYHEKLEPLVVEKTEIRLRILKCAKPDLILNT